MKSIIVPVDFSDQSEKALKVAASLAKQQNAELFVLHMLELSPAIMGDSGYISQEQVVHLIKLGEKRFSDFLDKPYLKDLKITPVIKHYKVFSEVAEVAEKHKADLIVMGSNGADGLQEIFIGSNTERVVRTSDIPVLVIKGNEVDDFNPKNFVFACDFEIYNDYTVEKGVINYSDKIGADLIGIPTHGRRGLSHFFMGSIGEDIANHSEAPVITFKI